MFLLRYKFVRFMMTWYKTAIFRTGYIIVLCPYMLSRCNVSPCAQSCLVVLHMNNRAKKNLVARYIEIMNTQQYNYI